AVGEASLTDPTGRQQHVDPATGAQIQNSLARVQIRHSNRVTAAKARDDGLDGQLILLVGGVEAGAESLINLTAAATRADRRIHSARWATTLITLDDWQGSGSRGLDGGRSCCVAQTNLFTDVSSRGHGEAALHQIYGYQCVGYSDIDRSQYVAHWSHDGFCNREGRHRGSGLLFA